MLNFIKNHFDFKVYGVTLLAVVIGLLIIPSLKYMPLTWGVENGVLENIQMFVLFVCVYLCATAKQHKKFFHFGILILLILIIREVNCGRTLFFPRPNTYHEYYSWRELPWPWLGKVVHGIYGTYIGVVALLFFVKKMHIKVWNMVQNIKLPMWNILIMCFAIIMGAIAEKLTNNNTIFEEGFELLFYICIMGIIYLYSRCKDFALENDD